ncbi:MAG: HEPN domain-containing protein [Chloroflexi bacterium]|nr:HEPN domain-containing protein [Chloroflexota bacterium]
MERSADWLDQAQGDLIHARHDLEAGFYDWACFSAQQAAEKAVKAVLHRAGVEAWGHSVADLVDVVGRSQPVLADLPADLMDAALELDKAYIPARYPDAHPSGSPRRRYTRTEAERMVGHAERIVRFSESLLAAA